MTDTPRPPRQMLTVEQAADSLGIGRTSMFALIKNGDIDSVRIGRLRRIPAEAIDTYTDHIKNQQEETA